MALSEAAISANLIAATTRCQDGPYLVQRMIVDLSAAYADIEREIVTDPPDRAEEAGRHPQMPKIALEEYLSLPQTDLRIY